MLSYNACTHAASSGRCNGTVNFEGTTTNMTNSHPHSGGNGGHNLPWPTIAKHLFSEICPAIWNKKLLGAPGIATRSKDATRSFSHYLGARLVTMRQVVMHLSSEHQVLLSLQKRVFDGWPLAMPILIKALMMFLVSPAWRSLLELFCWILFEMFAGGGPWMTLAPDAF